MNAFNHCPKCLSKQINWHNNHRLHCHDCHFVYYKNVASSVAVILKQNNQILFTVRNLEPKKGMLDLPGGFADPNETAEQTCSRELTEELGITIPPKEFTYLASLPNDYPYKNVLYHTLDLFFITKMPANAKINTEKEEIANTLWIEIDKINPNQIGFESMRRFFKTYSV